MRTKILENPLLRRVFKNSGYLFSATGIASALGMLQGVLVARLLGVAGFGILGAITMFTSVVNKFASFRMGDLVVKYVGQYTENKDHQRAAALFKIAALVEMAASLFAFGLIWLLAPLGARLFVKDPSATAWFEFYGLIVIANLVAESSTGLLQIFDRFRRIAIVNVLQSLVTLTIITFVYFNGGSFEGVLAAYLIGKACGALGLTALAFIEASHRWGKDWWRASLRPLATQRRELVHFAVSTNISATLSLINKDSELLWVSLFRNPVETGYYKLALSLANILQLPISPLPQATYPELSREIARRNWANVRTILRQGSIMAGVYTLAATIGLLLLGRPLIQIIYKPEYLPAFPALLILLTGYLVANTFYWNRVALLAVGRPDFPAKLNLALAICKVIGILILVPTFGYLANAGLLAGSYIIGVSISVLFFRRVLSRVEAAPVSDIRSG